jgi:hypothetical protein
VSNHAQSRTRTKAQSRRAKRQWTRPTAATVRKSSPSAAALDAAYLDSHEANRLALLKADEPRLKARASREARMIADALSGLPQESREAIGVGDYPANHLASSEAVQAVIDKILRKRMPRNQWLRVHRGLTGLDESSEDGAYNSFMDGFRDVAFLVGMDYALRALPAWFAVLPTLPDETRLSVGDYVNAAARHLREGEELLRRDRVVVHAPSKTRAGKGGAK